MTETPKKKDGLEPVDPCGSDGPTQWWALVWFMVALVGGMYLTYRLAVLDHWMYTHDAEVLDYEAYSENRKAFSSVPSEITDTRMRGDLHTAQKNVQDNMR